MVFYYVYHARNSTFLTMRFLLSYTFFEILVATEEAKHEHFPNQEQNFASLDIFYFLD